MNEPVTPSHMKDFVRCSIANITEEHEVIVSRWKNVELTDENITHLYNLFTKCNRNEIRSFEDVNFSNENKQEVIRLISTRLQNGTLNNQINNESQDTEKVIIPEIQITEAVEEKGGRADPLSIPQITISSVQEETSPELEQPSIPVENEEEKTQSDNRTLENSNYIDSEIREEKEPKSDEVSPSKNTAVTPKTKKKKKEKKKKERNERKETLIENEEKRIEIDEEQNDCQKNNRKQQSSDSEIFVKPKNKDEKKINPFDNDKCVVEPLVSSDSEVKPHDVVENAVNAIDTISSNYINPESKTLKSNLQKLATDISAEEKQIREKLESGEVESTDNEVLADFISRANTVLKQTEAVTVRKIAEAETRKFLSAVNVDSDSCFESLSNELMHDIWPKTNQWRSIARIKYEVQQPEEPIPQAIKKKMDEQLDRTVQAAIKSAGESLDKRQILKIRNAAIAYREFDAKEERELSFRSDQTLKLVEYVSAYEATNQMDELMRLRLAIAFCTKRRDFYLKAQVENFMQFAYMYIFFLEKINTKTASICACLNYHRTLKTNFDELEELLLNLFHEDYFLNDSGA